MTDAPDERRTKVLVLNSGSSSIKFELFGMDPLARLAEGLVERIGASDVRDHREGFERVLRAIAGSGSLRDASELFGIGHRVVHGGEAFRGAVRIDPGVVEAIRSLIPLAPLHNPANLEGIEVALRLAPRVPQVAVFDTAFHQTAPPRAFRYALPREHYTVHRVRRYGFHGTSHAYVARRAAEMAGLPAASLNLVTLHLGNGASAAAIRGGICIDTSMGMTPLEGLVMGTRCGDLDPSVPYYLSRATGRPAQEVERILNEESGLKGLCGAADMRDVRRMEADGDPDAALALEMYAYRVRKYIGAYFAALGRVDAVVFTAGVGENDAGIRARACEGLSPLGISLDEGRNRSGSREARAIHREGAPVRVFVIPTDEELEIARQTVSCLGQEGGQPRSREP